MPRVAVGALVVIALAAIVVVGGMVWRGQTPASPGEAEDGAPAAQAPSASQEAAVAGHRMATAQGRALYGRGSEAALVRSINGVELYYFWPGDRYQPSLSADETEWYLVNPTRAVVRVENPVATFTNQRGEIAHYSGTWETFPSPESWDRQDYKNIGLGTYRGTFTLGPNEKAKLHYHLRGSPTAARLQLTLTPAGSRPVAVDERLTRTADRGTPPPVSGGHGAEPRSGSGH